MKLLTFAVTLLLPTFAIAQGAGDLCKNHVGQIGICESTGWCNQESGSYQSGFCPNAPEDIKCCFFPLCNGGNGYCISTTFQCTGGRFINNECPGPSSFKCCAW